MQDEHEPASTARATLAWHGCGMRARESKKPASSFLLGCRRRPRRRRHSRQLFEEVGERLRHASRVLDAKLTCTCPERKQGESHGHPMVLVRVHVHWAGIFFCFFFFFFFALLLFSRRRQRVDFQPIGARVNACSELPQLRRHGIEPVTFFHPPAADPSNDSGPVPEKGQGSERHRRIGDVIEIQVDRPQLSGCWHGHVYMVRFPGDLGTHVLEHGYKADIPLERSPVQSRDSHGTARKQRPSEKIRGRGRIRLYTVLPGARENPGIHEVHALRDSRDIRAECRGHGHRHINIRLRYQTVNFNGGWSALREHC
mmetsp:Transcript_11187/g.21448  ORF Transcript_11187/g.21448 Transcript_11187/m.21448 type:complete len:313 (-) Transcript_11187:54-992(-)